ncbi:hypothetical protein Nm8I071_25570 [Nonomuraea sp. TT08I-71]|nr:hypothetical protein Nm8I071_25570 [Nonomuraea sp. TT08I-71]
MSTSSYWASSRWAAISCTQRATVSPLRPGRVLPMMMPILVIAVPSVRGPASAGTGGVYPVGMVSNGIITGLSASR